MDLIHMLSIFHHYVIDCGLVFSITFTDKSPSEYDNGKLVYAVRAASSIMTQFLSTDQLD